MPSIGEVFLVGAVVVMVLIGIRINRVGDFIGRALPGSGRAADEEPEA